MIQKKATQKAKKNPPKKPRPQRQRRAFSFDTYQASIRMINFRGKRCLLRISRLEPHDPIGTSATRANAIKSYALHKIFHTLFPQNSIEPVGIKKVVEGGEAGGALSQKSSKTGALNTRYTNKHSTCHVQK